MSADHLDDATLMQSTGTEATLASSEGADATLAAGSGGGNSATSAAAVRTGGRSDLQKLHVVDPQFYDVGGELARGGMGRILSARDRRLGRPVAIKELLVESIDLRARFEREARITAKLQHPSIVNVIELGQWPSGEPFYVMKLVTGQSLSEVIADRKTVNERLALLPSIIAAVDALAYAHHRRVIHRDLKPSNILVGEFGETVVIDWGLAKDLVDKTEQQPAAPGPSFDSKPGETVHGSVIGTPGFMPAEQALGGTVDERADVFALGAILYQLLAGAAPYSGKTVEEILGKVIKGPPKPLTERAEDIPPDLITIVEKAMAHDADDRYPTAKELADDLKKFQTGQLVGAHRYSTWQLVQRWMRRHRLAVSVAASALVVLGVVGAISVTKIVRAERQATSEREAALKHRASAEDLLDFMLGDLRLKLRRAGKPKLLGSVARRASEHYKTTPPSTLDDERRHALAYRTIGDVLVDEGDITAALDHYHRSLGIAESLLARDPAPAVRKADLEELHFRIGDTLFSKGDIATAITELRTALTLGTELVAATPDDPARIDVLAATTTRLAELLHQRGELDEALGKHREALALLEKAIAKHPNDNKLHRRLARTNTRLGDLLGDRSDPETGIRYRSALVSLQRLVKEDPEDTMVAAFLAQLHGKLGGVLLQQGDRGAALAEFRESLEQSKILAQRDPANVDSQRSFAIANNRYSDAVVASDPALALEGYRKAAEIQRRLLERDPNHPVWLADLAQSHLAAGNALRAMKRVSEALTEHELSVELSRKSLAHSPDDAVVRALLASRLFAVGDDHRALSAGEAAMRAYRQGLEIAETVRKQWPKLVAEGQSRIGEVMLERGDPKAALAAFTIAAEIMRALAKQTPTVFQQDLAAIEESVGDAHVAAGDRAKAGSFYQAALAALAPVPSSSEVESARAKLHAKLGTKR